MKKVVDKLRQYSKQIDITTRFDVDFDIDTNIFTGTESKSLLSAQKMSIYEKNIELKRILKNKYDELYDISSLNFWIINNWGGITSFKPTENNKSKIVLFDEQLEKGKLTKKNFSTISSLSKIASFKDPDNYVIYDSRVIYALNWIILRTENNEKYKQDYFPIPNGRNNIITSFDMKTLLNVFHIDKFEKEENIFRNENTAYFDYCEFIRNASKEIYGKESFPYQLEMLLFSIAYEEIFEDIKSELKNYTQ